VLTKPLSRRSALQAIGTAAAAATLRPRRATAAGSLRVAKSLPDLFAYTPIDVGLAIGAYQRAGVELEVISFSGSSTMHRAMVAGTLDIALGGGVTMVNIAKGEPALGIAQTVGPPVELGIMTYWDSDIRTLDDLKGKTVGIATKGSPTEWMLLELCRLKGWPLDAIRTAAIGGSVAYIAGLRARTVDAVCGDIALAFRLEPEKQVRLVAPCSEYVSSFIMHTNYASLPVIKSKPEEIRAFNKGWFEAVAFMKANRAETLRITNPVTTLPPGAAERNYDLVMPHFSDTGRFDPKGLATLARSFVQLGSIAKEPDMSKLYTEEFLPAA
jgi:NitT/TauT family transport system substrate-binding protein